MKVLKYLIKPLELLVFLCLLAALVYFRSAIFHSNVNQYIDKAVAYTEREFEIAIPAHINNEVVPAPVAQAECEEVIKSDEIVKAEVTVEDVQKNDAEHQPNVLETDVKSEEESALVETLSEAVSVINEKVDALFEANKSTPSAEPVVESNDADVSAALDVKKEADLTVAEEVVVSSVTDVPAVDTKQVLYTARKLFWGGNVQASEKLYLELASLDDSDPNVYGELGNIYYSQGKWKQAGKAYYEAAVRLLDESGGGRVNSRVSYLLKVIQGLDTESAEKLKNKISG